MYSFSLEHIANNTYVCNVRVPGYIFKCLQDSIQTYSSSYFSSFVSMMLRDRLAYFFQLSFAKRKSQTRMTKQSAKKLVRHESLRPHFEQGSKRTYLVRESEILSDTNILYVHSAEENHL